jgi:hypothetical protein
MINFKRNYMTLMAIIAFAAFLFGVSPALAQVSLGAAQSFGVLGGSAVTNTGPTIVIGDVGVSPGSAITGFPPGMVVGGSLHSNDALAVQAHMDMSIAYNDLLGMTCNTNLSGQDLAGLTLAPGIYCYNTSAFLTGALILDAQGNPNAIFIIQIGTTLITSTGSSVTVIGGGSPHNVYWQVGTSATLGTGTAFAGHILAAASITVTTGASVQGSLLARDGAVTLDSNLITNAACTPPPADMISWYPGEGNANDIAGSNHGTLLNGTIFATGKVNQAFSFDGMDDEVQVANQVSLEPQTLTVDFWFNSTTPGDRAYLLSKGADGCLSASYSINKDGTGGGLAFDVVINGALVRSPFSAATVFNGNWHFVAGTYDGTTVRLFIDGQEVGTGTPATGAITYGLSSTNDLFFGTYPESTCKAQFHYNGLLDEVELFSRALTLTEIQAIYNAGSAGKCPCQIICPVNITVSNDPNQCGAVVSYPAPKGDCGKVICSPPSGSFFPTGTTTVSCNITTSQPCSFTVTVNDTQPPSITCPANIVTDENPAGSGSAIVTYANPTVTDNCPLTCSPGRPARPNGACTPGVSSCNPPSGSTFNVGTTTVTCDACDCAGNSASCTFTVTVNAVCIITCPANLTVSNDPNQCGAVVKYPAPTTNGSCATVTCLPASGSFFPVGTTTVTCTTTAGPNCTFTITVNDTQAPTITCPTNVTAVAPPACAATSGTVVTYAPPTASDNCPGVTVVCVPPSGSPFPLGATSVTCTATDASGNTATCSFSVRMFNVCVQDRSNPAAVLAWNTTTGEYIFCCNGSVFTGVGKVAVRGCTYTLNHNPVGRRVHGQVDFTTFRGEGGLQLPVGTIRCSISDDDVRNNDCACVGGGGPARPSN